MNNTISLNLINIDDKIPELKGTEFKIAGNWLLEQNNKYYINHEAIQLFKNHYGANLTKKEVKNLLKLDSILALKNIKFDVIPFIKNDEFEVKVTSKKGHELTLEELEHLLNEYYNNFDREGYPIAKEGEFREKGTKYIINDKQKQENMDSSHKLLKKLIIKFPILTKFVFDKDILLEVLKEDKNNIGIFLHMNDKFTSNEEFMLNSIKINKENYKMASNDLVAAKDFALKCAKIDGTLLRYMSGVYTVDISYEPYYDRYGNRYDKAERYFDFKDDNDVVLTAVRQNPLALQYAELEYPKFINEKYNQEKQRKVKEIVMEALNNDTRMYYYVPEWISNDNDIIECVQGKILKHNEKVKTLTK